MARGRTMAVERAILVEALRGATRTELWLAARRVSRFITTDEVDQVLNALLAAGQLEKTASRWTTTPAGQARLDRSTA
jgi:hypothetical protein